MALLRHAYVHVPFCPTICPFCDFHVLERRAGAVDAYLDRLELELRHTAARLELQPGGLDTLYVGGGTPSHLRESELTRLVELVRRHLGWPEVEATLEAHPSTVSAARAATWADLGFTRLSLGVQSASDAVLRFLGRPHDAATALGALDTLVAADRSAVSADLITAVPGQDVEADLDAVARRGIDHLSAYTLTVEEGTPFWRDGVEVDPDDERRAFLLAGEVAARYGLARYEVSNHARPGCESAHNLGYWRNHRYLGIGPGASAYEPPAADDPPDVVGWRRTNLPFERWLGAPPDEVAPGEPVRRRDAAVEGLLVGLRLTEGVDLERLSAQCGLDVAACFDGPLRQAVAVGHLLFDGTRLRASEAGLFVLDRVLGAFV